VDTYVDSCAGRVEYAEDVEAADAGRGAEEEDERERLPSSASSAGESSAGTEMGKDAVAAG
jgi:hypothetical protein